MKASELRIGSYVYFEDELLKFDFEMGWNFDYIKPIPLTEEWLLKFGFVGNYKTYYSNINLICELHFDEFNNQFDCILDRYSITTIQYVHELQNLYFALTNEEL